MARPLIIIKIEEFQKDKKIINMEDLAKHLRYKIEFKKFDKSYLAARVYNTSKEEREKSTDDKYKAIIELSEKLDVSTKNTIIALLIAEHILNENKFSIPNYILDYDVFQLKEIRRNKFSKTVQLAIRLAVPSEIINGLDDLSFQRDKYAKESGLNQDFIGCVVKDHSLDFLMSNELIWNTLELKKQASEEIKKNA